MTSDLAAGFGELCRDTRAGFTDAIDLLLIHNEQTVRGRQPRATLNPLTLLLAVAAWERFVVDVDALTSGQWKHAGVHRKRNGAPYLGHEDSSEPGPALQILGSASGGRLPKVWRIRTFSRWTGKHPEVPVELDGADLGPLAREVAAAVTTRNKVAHRCMPQDRLEDRYWNSKAAVHNVQAGWARTVLAVCLQLTDQAIAALTAEAGFERPGKYRLPTTWFAAKAPSGLRGVDTPGPLWGGHALIRP